MQVFRSRLAVLGLLTVLLMTLALAACGDDDDDDDDGGDESPAATSQNGGDGGGGGVDYGSLSGDIEIDGSSTVYPITAAMAEEFASVAPEVLVNVAFSGTGGGFERFCGDEIQISNASRPIDADEITACGTGGIPEAEIVEIQVGIDALTVMVHPDNDFVECLTLEQLNSIFKTGGVSNWSEVDPSFPDEEIALYYPGTDSGTFDYFVEAVIEELDEAGTHRGDGTSSEDDNILAQGLEGDPNSIGYFGFAYFQEAGENLKAVQVDAGEGCVEPSSETALDGSYYLSRPLFIYTSETLLGQPEVAGFVNFYLENVEAIVPEVGYVQLPDDLLQEQVAKIEPFLP